MTRPRRRAAAPVSIVVYHPEPGEAAAYARLIRRRRGVVVRACATAEEMLPVIGQADVLYGWNVPPGVLARAARLRWFQNMGAGVERVLVPELRPEAAVTRVAGIFGSWMAEYTLGWCLWVTQRVETFRARQRERRWAPIDPKRLHGATLCVVGLGDIGRVIARAARAVGMDVIGVSRSGRRVPAVSAVYRPADRKRALARADFAVLTLPLTEATRGFIGAGELGAMRPTAWLINVARGPIVDETALVAALRARRIGGAVLDVFATEPLPADHPLWGLDNAVITPHISGPSVPDEIAPIFEENLSRFLAGRRLRFAVDRRRGY